MQSMSTLHVIWNIRGPNRENYKKNSVVPTRSKRGSTTLTIFNSFFRLHADDQGAHSFPKKRSCSNYFGCESGSSGLLFDYWIGIRLLYPALWCGLSNSRTQSVGKSKEKLSKLIKSLVVFVIE